MLGELLTSTILIYFGSYILAVVGGHFFVCVILKKYPLPEEGGLEGAGAMIGILERIFTLTLVLVGQYMALALVLAAKSIARFEDLKNRKFAYRRTSFSRGTLREIMNFAPHIANHAFREKKWKWPNIKKMNRCVKNRN